ncbi:MAG: 4-hydroxy-tetrahydrodipicolinate synthase [Bacteroidales bacterium]|nr:4-hydroxy-tetrahydrodipicolinate synthase [Bacteroidales bacterium]
MILRGCGTALVTPFRDGKVDFEAYEKLVRRQVEAGIDFLVPLGSTAETPCLEDDEKVELLRIARELCPDRPVVVGVGTNSPAATVRNIKLLEPLGPDAYLVVVPYYNKPTQEGIYRYFAHVAQATSKGIVAYNVPGRTGTNMKAATTLRVAGIPNVIAVKEASGDLAQVKEVIDGRPEGFSVLSGNDDQTLRIVSDGGDGVISVASNIAPALMEEFVTAALRGDSKAESLDSKLVPLYDGCFVESNPIPAKAGLSLLGLCTPEMRLPLTEAVPSTFDAMKRILGDLGL